MKFRVLALPTITFLAAGAWVVSGNIKVSRIELGNRQLQRELATLKTATPEAAPLPPPSTRVDPKMIDLKTLASLMAGRGGSPPERNELLGFQHSLMKMSADQLVALLDEVATLNLPKKHRDDLEFSLFSALVGKAPESAFDRFSGSVESADSPIGINFTTMLRLFAEKEPARAVAWLDRQIASGALDSKSLSNGNTSRNRFEGVLLGVLISSDFPAASARLAALPQHDRLEAIASSSWLQTEGDQLALIKLTRQQLSEEDQGEAIASLANRVFGNRMDGQDEFIKVTTFLDRANASAADRAKAVEAVAMSKIMSLIPDKGKLTAGQFDNLRNWAISQSPENANKVSGNALMYSTILGSNMTFDDAANLAASYRDSSGYEQLLTGFFSMIPTALTPENRERARGLAEQISDPAARSLALNMLK